jgi:hypothetical protein
MQIEPWKAEESREERREAVMAAWVAHQATGQHVTAEEGSVSGKKCWPLEALPRAPERRMVGLQELALRIPG